MGGNHVVSSATKNDHDLLSSVRRPVFGGLRRGSTVGIWVVGVYRVSRTSHGVHFFDSRKEVRLSIMRGVIFDRVTTSQA